ncbi:3-ketoacyl-ACP reductase [Acidocella aquatica]|uniref:3-ketoacyl-ACP reductase n=1 Tax=Acidocella aquatica TaxID=1922313 RepID=A0ABQ6A933_9PROT|nr:SDR family NAD(P)-dependent oxidoreductase [Acidocella aquatica]GLR68252.1 3-ketoacyl-ACP reductase [Acidocella aquatica]
MSVVIVTGGFGVLGRVVAADLTKRGHKVAAVDVAPAPGEYGNALALGGVDLTDETAVKAAYATVAERLGSVDGLVNIAGGFIWGLVEGNGLAGWDKMFRMNLRTAATSSSAALPYLLRQGGAIVNIGAFGAIRPGAGMAPYAASKAGVHALTESLAEELRGKGVRVNAVLPTIIDTPTNRADMPDADTAGWVRPESAAKVIAFLLSSEAGAITGATIPLSLAG